MKKLLPIAAIGAAVGAFTLLLKRKNDVHVQDTLATLDELSDSAKDTVDRLASEVVDFDSETE